MKLEKERNHNFLIPRNVEPSTCCLDKYTKAGLLAAQPGLTAEMLAKNLEDYIATTKGH